LTDGSGTIVERYAYSAYGVPTITNASATLRTESSYNNRYMYTGREWDQSLQMYHYRARMYDANLGRFCSKDPIGYVDGVNLFRRYFTLEDVDPLGLCKIKFTKVSILKQNNSLGGWNEVPPFTPLEYARTSTGFIWTMFGSIYSWYSGGESATVSAYQSVYIKTSRWPVLGDRMVQAHGGLVETTYTCDSSCGCDLVSSGAMLNKSNQSSGLGPAYMAAGAGAAITELRLSPTRIRVSAETLGSVQGSVGFSIGGSHGGVSGSLSASSGSETVWGISTSMLIGCVNGGTNAPDQPIGTEDEPVGHQFGIGDGFEI
jgi:RHS repeat-associated protein